MDVDAINLVMLDAGDGKTECALADFFKQMLALPPCELLGIVDTRGQTEGIKDDRGSHHRAGNRAAPDLVGAGNQPMPGGKQSALDTRVTRHRKTTRRRGDTGTRRRKML